MCSSSALPAAIGIFMDNPNHLLDRIFLEAGTALLDCQGFESSLRMALFFVSILDQSSLDTNFATLILEGGDRRTAGQLIGLLRKHVTLGQDVEGELTDALELRNHLIHHYFLSNVDGFSDKQERDRIVKEIRDMRGKIGRVVSKLDYICSQIASKIGYEEYLHDKAEIQKEVRAVVRGNGSPQS